MRSGTEIEEGLRVPGCLGAGVPGDGGAESAGCQVPTVGALARSTRATTGRADSMTGQSAVSAAAIEGVPEDGS